MNVEEGYKIGLVLDDSLDKPDGVQQYVLALGTYLASIGHDVHYLVGETKRKDLPNLHSLSRNIKVRFNANRMSMPLPADRKAIQTLLDKEEFDILHIQMPYSPFMAGRVIQLASLQTAVVGTFHIAPHSFLVSVANWTLRLFISKSIERFDEVMSVSKTAQDFAWKTFNIESSLVPNTVPLGGFFSAKPFDEYKDVLTFVFLGRLVERKGCRQLLEAIRHIEHHKLVGQKYRVVICGSGPMEQSLKRFVADHRLGGIVEFKGQISEEDKPRYLASADVAVFPSTGGESFGIVLIEAMAAARGAVLAGNNPGYSRVMGSLPDALFDPNNTVRMAEKIAALANDPEVRGAMHLWQHEYVGRFDVSKVADEILALYDSALHKRRQ